jgi:hypothetical protein
VARGTCLIKDRLLVFLDFSGLIGGHSTTILLLTVISVDYLLHVVTAGQLIFLIVRD